MYHFILSGFLAVVACLFFSPMVWIMWPLVRLAWIVHFVFYPSFHAFYVQCCLLAAFYCNMWVACLVAAWWLYWTLFMMTDYFTFYLIMRNGSASDLLENAMEYEKNLTRHSFYRAIFTKGTDVREMRTKMRLGFRWDRTKTANAHMYISYPVFIELNNMMCYTLKVIVLNNMGNFCMSVIPFVFGCCTFLGFGILAVMAMGVFTSKLYQENMVLVFCNIVAAVFSWAGWFLMKLFTNSRFRLTLIFLCSTLFYMHNALFFYDHEQLQENKANTRMHYKACGKDFHYIPNQHKWGYWEEDDAYKTSVLPHFMHMVQAHPGGSYMNHGRMLLPNTFGLENGYAPETCPKYKQFPDHNVRPPVEYEYKWVNILSEFWDDWKKTVIEGLIPSDKVMVNMEAIWNSYWLSSYVSLKDIFSVIDAVVPNCSSNVMGAVSGLVDSLV